MSKSISTIIIGARSNLSVHLKNAIDYAVLIETMNISESLNDFFINKIDTKVNIIFNNFQSSSYLNDLSRPSEYIYRSIQATSVVLDFVINNNIRVNKLIYTSSSSVYGNNIYGSEDDQPQPINLHASLKLANEKLIEKFALDNKIDFIINRIYNMYGGSDNFSVVSKIINSYKEKGTLTLSNNGNAIRDFINIEDVVNIYKILLNMKCNGIINIGTGTGSSIKGILDYLTINKIYLNTINVNRDELKVSTANNNKLLNLIGSYEFLKLEDYILSKIKEV